MKILTNGIAVVAGDTHISQWVQDHGKLNIAEEMLKPFQKYVPKDSNVIDVGASIGDHTITYAEWVGEQGLVIAFEPNPEAFSCLYHNTRYLQQVLPIDSVLSDSEETVLLNKLDNSGASYYTVSDHGTLTAKLDDYDLHNISFIKIDAEGFETKIIRGAVNTIAKWRPVLLVEVNHEALRRIGSSYSELLALIQSYNYSVQITDSRIIWSDPQYDIVCVPIEKAH
jgi:FkbM family methyltransferase